MSDYASSAASWTAPAITWTKDTNSYYTAQVEVSLRCADGPGCYIVNVMLRLDGREGKFYRADQACLSPWASLNGRETDDTAPRNLLEGKALAARWLTAVGTQGTLTPRDWL